VVDSDISNRLLVILLVLGIAGLARLQIGLLGIRVGLALGVGLLDALLVGLVDALERLLLRGGGILADSGVQLLVHFLHVVGRDVGIQVGSKVLLEVLLIVLLHLLHVVGDVLTKDVGLVDLSIVSLGVTVVAGESLVGVGNVQSTIRSTFHGAKDLAASGGVLDSDIEQAAEGSAARLLIDFLDVVGAAVLALASLDLAIRLLVTLVHVIEADLLEQSAGAQQAGRVGGGVVLEAHGQAVIEALQLLRVGGADDLVTDDFGRHDLDIDELVGEADHQAVLGGLVLVLVLGDELVALTVVSAALASSAELRLEALEVRLVLHNLNKWL
jgi:hypothetical protein